MRHSGAICCLQLKIKTCET